MKHAILNFTDSSIRWLGSRPLLIFFFWSLWLSFEYFAFGSSSYVRVFDNGDSFLPAKLGLSHISSDGWFNFWNPQWTAGVDTLAAGLTTELDNLLFAVMPGWLAYGLISWFQRFIAGYFTFRLLKESFKLDTLPALYAGLAYSLFSQWRLNDPSGFTLFDYLTLPGLPLLLWALGRMVMIDWRWSYPGAAVLGLIYAFTSAYPFAVFVIPLVLYWTVFITPGSRPGTWALAPVFAAFWFIGELPVLWASWLNASESHRAVWTQSSINSSHLMAQVTFTGDLVRSNIISIGLFSAGLGGMILSRTLERRLILVAVALLTSLGLVTLLPLLKVVLFDTNFQFLSGFSMGRTSLLVPFLAAVCGAAGAQLIPREWPAQLPSRVYNLPKIPLRTLCLAAAISLISWQSIKQKLITREALHQGRTYANLYAHPAVQQLADKKSMLPPFRVATIADDFRFGALHPASVWAYGLESVDGYVLLFPKRYRDFWELVVSPSFEQGSTSVQRVRRTHRNYLFPPRDGFAAEKEVDFEHYYDLNLLSLTNVRFIISPVRLQHDSLIPLPTDADGAQPLIEPHKPGMNSSPGPESRNSTRPLYVYENVEAFPRFFAVGQVQVFDQSTMVLKSLGEASLDSLKSTAYLLREESADLPLDQLTPDTKRSVKLISYGPDQIVLNVKLESDSILVITNTYSPYWNAYVDENESRVFPVDHSFQGIFIEKGQHEIILEYEPPYSISRQKGRRRK